MKAIKGDQDINDIVFNQNMKDENEFKSFRRIDQPIIIGEISRGGPSSCI